MTALYDTMDADLRENLQGMNARSFLQRRGRNTIPKSMAWTTPDDHGDPDQILDNRTFRDTTARLFGASRTTSNPSTEIHDVDDNPEPYDVDATPDPSLSSNTTTIANKLRGDLQEHMMAGIIRDTLPMAAMSLQPTPEKWPANHVQIQRDRKVSRTGGGVPRADVGVITASANMIPFDFSNVDLTAPSNKRMPPRTDDVIEIRPLVAHPLIDDTPVDAEHSRLSSTQKEIDDYRIAQETILDAVYEDKLTYTPYFRQPLVAFVCTTTGGRTNDARRSVLRGTRFIFAQARRWRDEEDWVACRKADRLWKLNSFVMVKAWQQALDVAHTGIIPKRTTTKRIIRRGNRTAARN
jgi:hypothetical protein